MPEMTCISLQRGQYVEYLVILPILNMPYQTKLYGCGLPHIEIRRVYVPNGE